MNIYSVQVNPGQHVKGVHEIIPLQALKEISERLPQTEEELRRYNHMFAAHKLKLKLYGSVVDPDRKTLILLFCNFFMTFYLRKIM